MQFTTRKIFSITTAIAVALGTLLIVLRNFQSPFINIPIGVLAALGVYCSPVALPLIGFLTGRYVLEFQGMDLLAFVFIFALLGPVVSVLCYYLLGTVIGINEPLFF